MGRFKLVKTIPLKDISDGWGDDTFVRFNVLTPEASADISTKISAVGDDEAKLTEIFKQALKGMFIDGKVQLPEEGLSDALADDVDDLPKGVIIEAFNRINGNVYTDPNA